MNNQQIQSFSINISQTEFNALSSEEKVALLTAKKISLTAQNGTYTANIAKNETAITSISAAITEIQSAQS